MIITAAGDRHGFGKVGSSLHQFVEVFIIGGVISRLAWDWIRFGCEGVVAIISLVAAPMV